MDPARCPSVILFPDLACFSLPLQHHWGVLLVLPSEKHKYKGEDDRDYGYSIYEDRLQLPKIVSGNVTLNLFPRPMSKMSKMSQNHDRYSLDSSAGHIKNIKLINIMVERIWNIYTQISRKVFVNQNYSLGNGVAYCRF